MTRGDVLAMAGMVAATKVQTARTMSEAEFEIFYGRTAPRLRSYLRRITGNEAQADDFLQDSYIRFLGSSFQSDDPAQATAYLYRIATNLVRDNARRAYRERPMETYEEPRTSPGIDARLDMQRLFLRLRPRERSLLWLGHVLGLSHKEIADRTGVGESSVRVALFRARRSLADLVRRQGAARRTT